MPVLGDPDVERSLDRFNSNTRSMRVIAVGETDKRYQGSTTEVLPVRARAAASAARAEPHVPSEPTPFYTSRRVAGAVLGASLAVAVLAFVVWYAETVRSLTKTADASRADRDVTINAIAGVSKLAPPSAVNPPPTVPIAPYRRARTISPSTAQIGDMVVGVAAARVQTFAQPVRSEQLVLTLRITNLSTKPITYRSWSRPDVAVSLRDQFRNYYNRIPSASESELRIGPGNTVTDTLMFEAPPEAVELELDLPTPGEGDAFEFRLPMGQVQRTTPSVTPAPAPRPRVQEPPPRPPPEPYDPEKDERLCSTVRSEYRAGVNHIERRAQGMTFDRGNRFRRTECNTLIKSICDKHSLTVDQVRRIIGLQ
jgi:hypothetical protein